MFILNEQNFVCPDNTLERRKPLQSDWMTPIAEALKPYTLYLIYAQILLLSLAIFVGAMLIIRRLWRREPVDGGLIQDREKLAAEIHEEVLRLQDLRNRLDSSYIIEGKDISASPVPRVLGTQTAHEPSAGPGAMAVSPGAGATAVSPAASATAVSPGASATANALSQIELEAKIHESTQHLTKEISVLNDKLSRAEEQLKNTSTAAPASDTSALVADQEATKQELQELKEKLEDYQAFEDEIALVKQYKTENESLRAQLAAGGGTPTAIVEGISEEDIASLFAEMASDAPGDAESPAEPDNFEALLAQKDEPTEDQVFAATPREPEEKTVFKSDPQEVEELKADEGDAPPRKGYVQEAKSEEPQMPSVNEENAEALAELGDDDQLMAEFEKVLNTKDQEKTS